jgi:hypothetical protein
LPGNRFAKRRAAAIVTCGTHRERQNVFNVSQEEVCVNTEFSPLASFSQIPFRWLSPMAI